MSLSESQSGTTAESGALPGRYEWAVEPTPGGVPQDIEWNRFSDVIRTFEMDPGASLARQDGIGTPDAVDHNRGTEEPTATVGYDLQRFPVDFNLSDPSGSSTLGVKSTDAGDTSLDVTIYNDDESASETITTDGSDATTFVTGATSFDTVGRVTVSGSHAGDIEIYTDDSGSAGTLLGTLASGTTDLEDITPVDASAYGILRDTFNDLLGTLLAVGRREYGGGNDDAGVREFSVIRGAAVDSVTPTLDPSSEQPILMELSLTSRKARSYLVHQPAAETTLDIVSTEDVDAMDITIETEDGSTTETLSLNGTTTVTTTASFANIDAVWLADNPEGNVTITDGDGTTLVELTGGLEYSDDAQPVDGDRGIPPTGSGSHAGEIGTSFEHFLGDRFERPAGDAVRTRINSAGWTIENNVSTDSLHNTRAPTVDAGNRGVTVDADAAGPFISHKSMMESLQGVQQHIEHELSGGILRFKNAVPTDSATRTIEAEQAVASVSETFSCSGDPAIELEATN